MLSSGPWTSSQHGHPRMLSLRAAQSKISGGARGVGLARATRSDAQSSSPARCFDMYLRCESPMLARGQPFLEMAMATVDIRRMNDQSMHALLQLHNSGRLQRRLLLHRLWMWRNMCAQAQVDVTHGLFNQVCHLIGVTVAELTEFEQAVYAKEMGMAGGEAQVPSTGVNAQRIEQSQMFKKFDDGASMLMVAMSCAAGVAVGMNKVARLFCTSAQGEQYVKTHRMLPMHAFASMLAPSDRLLFFELHVAVYSTVQQPCTTLEKFCSNSGDIDVYILRLRSVETPEPPDAHLVTVLEMEPAPPSRHLVLRPGHRHHIVQAFRQRAAVRPTGASMAGSEVNTAAAAAVPGIAYVPLPPAQKGCALPLPNAARGAQPQ